MLFIICLRTKRMAWKRGLYNGMRAVILAGGKGTRLGTLTASLPKPLVCVGEKPVLEHQLLLLKKYGITRITILTGYCGNKIKQFVGSGSRWGMEIQCREEQEPQGTAGALRSLQNSTHEDFLLFSGDIMVNFDISRLIRWHGDRKTAVATVMVHPSRHPVDSDLIDVDADMKITTLLYRPHPSGLLFRNLGIASLYVITPSFFSYIPETGKCDIEKDIFPRVLAHGGTLYAYQTPEYMRDMGTPDRLQSVNRDYEAGTIAACNLEAKRPAIFLDRDGVINKGGTGVTRLDDMEIIQDARSAIRRINDSPYLSIVITNQPVIAKGILSIRELDDIHKKMETELGDAGAVIDGLYYCPHHPKKGFAGEIPELKIACSCRKPNTGLFMRAAEEFNIDLARSVFIGDSTSDAKAAENLGIRFVGVSTGNGLNDGEYQFSRAPVVVPTIAEAVDQILTS